MQLKKLKSGISDPEYVDVPSKAPLRKCRNCSKHLPLTLYFYCPECTYSKIECAEYLDYHDIASFNFGAR